MWYDEMHTKYLRIDDAFQQVADDIHGGYTAVQAGKRIRDWVKGNILPFHRVEVLAKLEQWARVVAEAETFRREEQMTL